MEEGKWVTLKGGRKVFIKKGQSLTDAINDYDTKLTKKINTAEKRYIKAQQDKAFDKEAWAIAQTNEINNKNPDLDRSYHMTERKAARDYANSSNRVVDAEYKVKQLKKEQESFRVSAMYHGNKNYIKNTPAYNKKNEKKSFINKRGAIATITSEDEKYVTFTFNADCSSPNLECIPRDSFYSMLKHNNYKELKK